MVDHDNQMIGIIFEKCAINWAKHSSTNQNSLPLRYLYERMNDKDIEYNNHSRREQNPSKSEFRVSRHFQPPFFSVFEMSGCQDVFLPPLPPLPLFSVAWKLQINLHSHLILDLSD
jgi:hypothetical protein